jgi:tRNA (guanine-N7-)-methyltransferase
MIPQRAQLDNETREALLRENPRSFPSQNDIYGNDRPIEIEIGCGKAKFLIARAAENPQINFMGVDIIWKWMKYGVERSQKRGLDNIRFVKTDARELLRYGITPGSVSIFHIYFPDPWPKRRHRKRRLITGEFLRLLRSRLVDGGLIELATDHHDYYMQMRDAVVHSGGEWQRVLERANERPFEASFKTNYELKYESGGRRLHYFELQK